MPVSLMSVPCAACSGRRFQADILNVTRRGQSIHDVLQLTVAEGTHKGVGADNPRKSEFVNPDARVRCPTPDCWGDLVLFPTGRVDQDGIPSFHDMTQCPLCGERFELEPDIEDRDLWRFEMQNTRQIQANLFSYPYDFKVWDDLMLRRDVQGLAHDGYAIERKHFKDIEELLAGSDRM